MKRSQHILIILVTIVISILSPDKSYSQLTHDLGYIYGTVETRSGKTYEGFIRWGGEEVAWHDVFNSTKRSNAFNKPKSSNSSWGDIDWNFTSLWRNNYSGSSRSFSCLFGDIKRLELRSGSRVDVILRNGEAIKVEGGSNDIGTRLYISDRELGTLKIDWKKIDFIEFHAPPRGVEPPYEPYLYGKVNARRGQSFEGYIKWDNDERLLDDILDGEGCNNDDDELPFHAIVSIEKGHGESLVTTRNGDRFEMSGTNDVNSGNRGIHVYVEGMGSIEVPWKSFEDVTFEDKRTAGPSFQYFEANDGLQGSVTTYDGDEHEGLIIFDLDEMYGAEILDGEDDRITYQIPMRNISIIRPKNSSYSYVELRNGESLLLGDTQDVSDSNDGVIVINSNSNTHIDWDDVDEIVFR